ncbi:MAG: S8/S53 family peptidase [Candidatus Eremiobacteraeota bacterium]|nr:S8/S53 family peptidase [Candidatus Eremiobacteraeota bacterium]
MKLWKVAAVLALIGIAAPALAAGRPVSFAGLAPTTAWAPTATQAVPISHAAAAMHSMVATLPETVPLRIVVGLSTRDRAGATLFVRRQYTAGDPLFHRFVSPAQYTTMFNPTRTQAATVASYLQRAGFTNVTVEPNNLLISATGTASRVAAAFHTAIASTMWRGQLIYGNVTPAQVPAQLRGLVVAVLGLTNAYQMKTHIEVTSQEVASTRSPTAWHTPPPCLVVTSTGVCTFGVYGPKQYQTAYDACSTSCTGYNTSVAVMAEGNVSQVVKDLRYAETYWGLPQVPYTVKPVGLSSIDTSGLDEWDLDTQSSTGIAQTVKHLYVYDTTSLSDSDIALEFNHWVTDNLAQAGNASFGEPESLAYADGSMVVDDEVLNQAVSQGQTMFASTSDSGEGCSTLVATGVPLTGAPETCYPASSPYVVAVGGTTLDTNSPSYTYYGEHVWVATGGGYSKWESAPYWQQNGIVPGGPVLATGQAARAIADVAMCADNNGCPMYVFVNAPSSAEVGGTSLSSPLSMGVWARMQSSNANKLGFAAPVYYGVYGYYEPCPLGSKACAPTLSVPPPAPPDGTDLIGGFHDILYGSNGVLAFPGWDPPTGLGTADICKMQQAIKHSIFSGH